jgi:Flp pilus assembly protein TadD
MVFRPLPGAADEGRTIDKRWGEDYKTLVQQAAERDKRVTAGMATGRRDILGAILLAVVVALLFSLVLGADFTIYDDNIYVTENPWVRQGLTMAGAVRAFGVSTAANWHPLTWFSHMADVEVWGLNPFGHHLTSLSLHALNAGLLFVVLRMMTGSVAPSFFAAFFFAVHPLRVESVAWVAERKDVLSGTLFLLTLAAWNRYVRRPGPGRYAAVLVLCASGLAAKPMLVTLPFVLLLLDVWPLGRVSIQHPVGQGPGGSPAGIRPVRLVAEKIPLLILAAASCAVTMIAQQAGRAVTLTGSWHLWTKIGNALLAWIRYLGMTAWPAGLTVLHPLPVTPRSVWLAAGALLVLLVVTVGTVATIRRRPYLAAGWLWYAGMLVPVVGLVQVGGQAVAERYTYLPGIGLGMALAWWGTDMIRRVPRLRAPMVTVAVLWLAVLSAATWVQTGYWRDTGTLFRRQLDLYPDSWIGHDKLGLYLAETDRPREAEPHLRKAAELMPDAGRLTNLGNFLSRTGRTGEALEAYRAAVRIDPGYAPARYNQAALLAAAGDWDGARTEYEAAIRLVPGESIYHNNLAVALTRLGHDEEALVRYREAVRLDPSNAEARNNLGVALGKRGDEAGAVEQFRAALAARSGYVTAMGNLADALIRQGRKEEGLRTYQDVLGLDPANPRARWALLPR